jgi:hypothetical protein
MSVCGVMPLLRRATYLVFPAVFAISMTAGPAAMAQTHSFNDFSSSSQGLIADDADSAGGALAPAPSPSSGSGAGQSGGSYGYHDHSLTNHLTFEGGGGFNAPISDSSSYITWGGNFTVGGGYKFTNRISLLAEYQFIDDKLPGDLIAETGANGGNAHIWSLTLDPVVDLFPHRTNDFYVTGGGGFYRKVTNFTDPVNVEYCNYYYCGIGTQNQVIGHFSSNQGGWNVGAGFTHKLGGVSGDGRLKLFAEVRYLDILTPAVNSSPNDLGTTTVAADTKLIPVTLGVRW